MRLTLGQKGHRCVSLDTIIGHLSRGDTVHLMGLGVLEPTSRKERVVINPATKQPMKLPRMFSVKFNTSKMLRAALTARVR